MGRAIINQSRHSSLKDLASLRTMSTLFNIINAPLQGKVSYVKNIIYEILYVITTIAITYSKRLAFLSIPFVMD